MGESLGYNFSAPELNENYTSQAEYEEDAMDGTVYYLTNLVLSSIFKEDLFPPDLLDILDFENMDPFLDALIADWQSVVTENWRFTFAIVFGLIMTVLMPIAGLIWCCAKCCCNKKGRGIERQNSDSVCLGSGVFLLFVTSILFGIFGAVWFFASNSVLEGSVGVLPQKFSDTFDDVNLYIDNTVKQINHLSGENFGEVRTQFDKELEDTGDLLKATFDNITIDIEFDRLIELSENIIRIALTFNNETLAGVNNLMTNLNETVINLIGKVEELQANVAVLTDPSSVLCGILLPTGLSCNGLNSSMSAVNVESSNVPTPNIGEFKITEDAEEAIKNLRGQVTKAQDILGSFSGNFVSNYTSDITKKLDDIEKSIKDEVGEITGQLTDLRINSSLLPDEFEDYVDEFTTTISPAFTAPMALLCLILVLLFIGSILGCCGGVGGSVKTCGSRFFSVALGLFFFLGFFLWLITVILFFAGAVTDKLVCETIRDPSDTSEFGPKLNEFFQKELSSQLNNTQINLTLSEILDKCGNESGQGIYTLFQLNELYDVDSLKNWKTDYNIDDAIAEFDAQIEGAINSSVTATQIGEDTLDQIEILNATLANVTSGIFDLFKNTTDDVIAEETIEDLIKNFTEVKNTYAGTPSPDPSLLDQIDNILEGLHNVNEMIISLNATFENLSRYAEVPAMKETLELPITIKVTLDLLQKAGLYMDGKGRGAVTDQTGQTVDNVIDLVGSFVNYTINFMKEEVGRCGPIYKIYHSVLVNGLCHDIVNPFNGLWSGLGLVLFFFIPGLFLICCLDNIFRREKRRPKYANPEFHGNPAGPTTVYAETRFTTYEVPAHYRGKSGKRD